MPSAVLLIENLTLRSPQGYLIKGFSLQVGRAEIIALTGRSGIGKTSIAMAILGLLPKEIQQTGGTIQYFQQDGTVFSRPGNEDVWPSLRGCHVAFIQQDVFGAFNPVIRIEKQIFMILEERSGERSIARREDLIRLLQETGLQDPERILSSYPHQLSGGQLQRCLLGIAVLLKPSLIIADEPTSAIDKVNQLELLRVLKSIRKKFGIAFICITHDPFVISHLADREVSLDKDNISKSDWARHTAAADQDHSIVLSAQGVTYRHRFGGLISRAGSEIGPIHLDVKSKACIGIIGESGSGKSTLAYILVGMIKPDKGTILLDGKKIDFKKEKNIRWLRSKVQLVMQDGRGSLHPHKTIGYLMNEVGSQHSAAGIEKALFEVGLLPDILSRTQRSLSGGECLRINIARALLMEPDVLICDESTAALDERTRDGILKMLSGIISARDLSLVMISHDHSLLSSIADTLVVMHEGKIVESGPTMHVMKNPVHPVAAKIFAPGATFGS